MMTTTDRSVYELARLAGCGQPNGPESPGGEFLALVADTYAEAAEAGFHGETFEDAAHELADGCVPVYTHQRWQTFVDLAAYDEDTSDFATTDPYDLTAAAGVALYMVAVRLLDALHAEAEEVTA